MTDLRNWAGIRATTRTRRLRRAPTKGSMAVLALAFTLTACSALPDFANPIAIYNNTFGKSSAETADGSLQAYPRLSAASTRPQTTSAEERRRVVDGLVADRENARYVGQDVRAADRARPAVAATPKLVAVENRAVPAVPQGKVEVAAVGQAQDREAARRSALRRRDPAAPVPIEPRRRRNLAAVRDTVDSQGRRDAVAAAVPIEPRRRQEVAAVRDTVDSQGRRDALAAAVPIEPRRRQEVAAVRDPVDSRRIITTGREGGPQQERALIPRQRVPVPRSIIQRENSDEVPRRVQRPASASVTQPVKVARLVEEPVIRREAPQNSALRRPVETAAPRPAPVVIAQAQARSVPPRRRRTPARSSSVASAPGENALSKIYSEMLAASASTVTTAPANPAFKPTTALPLPAETLGVDPVVRESYNAALNAATAPPESPKVPQATRVVESRSRDTARARLPVRPRGTAQIESRAPTPAPAPAQVAALVVPRAPAPIPARRVALPRPFAVASEPALIIKFANGSAQVSLRNRRRLGEIAAQVQARGGVIRVVGHASSRTRDLPLAEHNLINFGLSLDRAQSVANQLMRQGVPPARIIVEARGDTDPIFFETMPEGEAENRRVEIFLDF